MQSAEPSNICVRRRKETSSRFLTIRNCFKTEVCTCAPATAQESETLTPALKRTFDSEDDIHDRVK